MEKVDCGNHDLWPVPELVAQRHQWFRRLGNFFESHPIESTAPAR